MPRGFSFLNCFKDPPPHSDVQHLPPLVHPLLLVPPVVVLVQNSAPLAASTSKELLQWSID